MMKDDIFYKAILSRDHRFDGKFFVGVKTTGIYCRPICPARPKRENIIFFPNRIAAEKAGFRPCLRCRPECAPQSPVWMGTSAVVQRAIRVLNYPETLQFNENQFAARFGVSARHLRRLFTEEIGKTPKQISFENRLNISRRLIVESSLPITEIAFASGFSSVRRFNDAFKERFKKPPTQIRRQKNIKSSGLSISLPYRPPFDFEGLLRSYEKHRIVDLEWFTDGKMHRVVAIGNKVGQIAISRDEKAVALRVEIDFPDTSAVLRHTDAFPASDLILARALEKHPITIIDSMRPWRGYVAALFWRSYSHLLTKAKKGKKL